MNVRTVEVPIEIELMRPMQTPRKCYVCMKPAVNWSFAKDATGKRVDKSSRRAVCEAHA